jgi:hypothetical protein
LQAINGTFLGDFPVDSNTGIINFHDNLTREANQMGGFSSTCKLFYTKLLFPRKSTVKAGDS